MATVVPAAAIAIVVVAGPATAADQAATTYEDHPGRQVVRWDATYDLDVDGSVQVVTEIDFSFGNQPGHGVIFTFPTTQPMDGNEERVWDISDVAASSPSGAPSNLSVERDGSTVAFRIGDPNIGNVSGVQTYQVSYSVAAVMNDTTSDETDTGIAGDEFYWNAIGSGWEVPISDITVTVNSPVEVLDAVCFAGPGGSTDGCAEPAVDGTTATFAVDAIGPWEPVTVATLYPAGTFDTTANTQVANPVARAFALTPWSIGGAVAVLGAGFYALRRHFKATAVDQQYASLTPGLAPVDGDEALVVPRDRNLPVAVQFEPPVGLRPGQLGTLLDGRADVRDVTAVIVDQAVRGYLRIDPVAGKKTLENPEDYMLVRLLAADDGLPAYSRTLFAAIFKGRDQVTLSELKTTFAADLSRVQSQMYKDVTDRGWFHRNPKVARGTWAGIAVAGLIGGALAAVLLARWSLALVAVPVVIVSIVMLAMTGSASARTAEGTRILAQTKGFKLFLETADGHRLRFEEGHDIFSQYLPYAIAFGVADKWAGVFARMAREGYEHPAPTWYGYYAPAMFWASHQNFGAQLSDFTRLADAAISTPTPGSSGGSGFSSGGGFSGGGSFGGGGGGW